MRVRALDSNGDWTFGAGLNNYLTGTAAVSQAIATRLLSFLGDCFFATNEGIDWFTFLGGSKNQLALQLAINAVILNTQSQGVNVITNIVAVSVQLNDVTRAFTVTYEVTSIFGTVTGTINQNLGIGPLAPPVNNLLPQFNQTLLNNVAATAITNALFNSNAFWEIDIEYFIERRTSTQGFLQRGTLICEWDPFALQWDIDNVILSGSSGPTTGVTFTINASTGQVSYVSDNVTGSGYVGNLIVQAVQTFNAGS
jgi:hypothetical protein